MLKKEPTYNEALETELAELRHQLEEANETIEAIRTGQIDALVVQSENGHQLYTLKSADQSYRVLIEKMSEGAVTLNEAGVILYSNSQYASMVNMPLSQVIGLPFDEFIAPENKSGFSELFRECWDHDCKGEVMLLAGEKRVPVQLSLTKLDLQDGVSLSIILTDLSSQKAAQLQLKQNVEQLAAINEALESSNHDLQQFASVASHDLQEPLRKIQVFSHLLKEKQTELTPEANHYLEKIIDSSARMKTLIIDILNYSRLSARDAPNEKVNLNNLLKDLKDDFELTINEKSAELHVMGMLPVIEVNKGQIRQVFQNIISNGLKFSQPGLAPVITVEAKRIREKSFDSPDDADGPYCMITINDNGIGFDEKYMDHIFALFERLHSKDKYEGTGIGLAIAKKIIDKHNGLITAKSREGRGASFMIILPMSPSNP
jgi:PAS domain S-box-containing protein